MLAPLSVGGLCCLDRAGRFLDSSTLEGSFKPALVAPRRRVDGGGASSGYVIGAGVFAAAEPRECPWGCMGWSGPEGWKDECGRSVTGYGKGGPRGTGPCLGGYGCGRNIAGCGQVDLEKVVQAGGEMNAEEM